MFASINGSRILQAEIVMPRVGAWIADLRVDAPDASALMGPVTISINDGEVVFVGTAFRPGDFKNRTSLRVVGGAGGLGTSMTPLNQRGGISLRQPVEAILRAAGETLSPESSLALLATPLGSWMRLGSPRNGQPETAATALQNILEPVGGSWRVLADGTVWVGTETWPGVTLEGVTTGEAPLDDIAEIASELPELRPGVTLNGRRVSVVVHRLEATKVRTKVYYERADQPFDRLKAAFFGLMRQALSPTQYHPQFAATVVRQSGNGELEVHCDDPRLARMSGVAMWPGVHGITTLVRRGARVLVGFADGDPKKRIATGWAESEIPIQVQLDADRINLGNAPTRGGARLDDHCDAGLLEIQTVTTPAPACFVRYTPPGSLVPTINTALGVQVVSDSLVQVPLEAKIDSASTKVYVE